MPRLGAPPEKPENIFHDRDFIPARHSLYYIKFILRWERNNDGTFHI